MSEKIWFGGGPPGTSRHFGRDRRERLGLAAQHEGFSQGANHDTAGWRLQEPERNGPQDAWAVRECAPLRFLSSIHRDQTSGHGYRDRARERRGSLRRNRISSDRSGNAGFEDYFAARLGKDCSLRL